MVCSTCQKRNNCVEICPRLRKFLPKENIARINYGHESPEELKKVLYEIRSVQAIVDFRDSLAGRQSQIIDLYYNDSLSQVEISRRLNLAQKTVYTHLKRAFRKIYNLSLR